MTKQEVLFFKFTQIDQDSPEQLVLHQFTSSRKFCITVPLLLGLDASITNFYSMVKLAKNKRAYIEYAEFFVHQPLDFGNYFPLNNKVLIVRYER